MKRLILLFSVLFSLQVMAQVNVTFRVDMQNVTGFTTPEVNGTFNGWCGNCNPMTDANGDNIWEVTLPLSAGSYEYKFSADSWGSQENLTPGSSCTVTNFGYTNRSLAVSTSDIVLPVVCWGSCSSCTNVYPVTFQVDMTQQTGFTTPEVNGSFNGWCGSCTPMTDANADGIWQTTVFLAPGTYEYKFSADGWGSQENLTPGSSCTVTNFGYTNRSLTVGNAAQTLSPVCWGACVACNAVVPSYNVTFQVDMTQTTGFTTPELNGTFNNWCGNCNQMTDANGDGIWEITLSLQAGSYEYKFAYDNWAGSEQLNAGSSCTVTNGGYTNRALTVSSNTVLAPVCFGSCSACVVAVPGCTDNTAANYNPAATTNNGSCLYNTTFNVDMNCAGVNFTNVYVTGPWCQWCGADTYNLLTDSNGDGIYTGTVQLAAGLVEYKYMVDNWSSQENLIDDMQAGGTCAPVTDYSNYANRQGTIGSTFNDVYGRCSACPAAVYNITFQVDMTQQTGFSTPAINGNFNGWCGACNPMTDANGDGIWEITLALAAGSYEYKFTADGWNMQENLIPGSSCTVTNFGYTNRSLTVVNADITQPVVCWGSCSACSAPSYNVTFQVDMTQQSGFTTPEVNGTFNGWCGSCTPMTDANADGIWEVTIPLQAGTYEYKFSADSWGSQENLTPGSSCTVTNFGYTNRSLTVSNSNITQPVVCWGSCSACAPIVVPGCTDVNASNYNPSATSNDNSCLYNHTFNVDMTCAGVNFNNVYVTGPWCLWCGADVYNIMTDANADGIYTVTVALPAGNVEYKYMVDNWSSQENLIDDMQNGASCAPVTDYWSYANRLVAVGSNNSDVYGRCTACQVAIPGCTDVTAVNYNSAATTDNGSCLYSTTFNVDMSCAGSFNNVYLTGTWCGWCGADVYNIMTDANADGIYTVTVSLPATLTEYKYMVDNWASQENLIDDMQNGGTCAPVTDYFSYANRTTTGGSTTNDVYGRCSACPILGCMNASACNYSATSTQDDGSCILPSLSYYTDADNDG